MQFHLNGFRPGDPAVKPVAPDRDATDDIDVLIVGCGPAGLTLAAQLAAFPTIRTRIVEQKSGPLELGQADGIACRSMEMFNAFGFAHAVQREAYWVNETTFWKPGESQQITRHGRIPDTEEGLSEFPHVILNQARVHDHFLACMRNAPSRLEPDYGLRFVDMTVPSSASAPIIVRLQPVDAPNGEGIQTVHAKYVVGCDGARSAVRKAIGRELVGESANQAWGVMDVLAYTDFPDIRLKSAIHSANDGNILIIPREGGYLVRLYIELDKLGINERVSAKNIQQEDLIAAAQRILSPYVLEVKEVAWWSVYEIGQRLCDSFENATAEFDTTSHPRVFIAGDACHTHSPKAGQGMNVSMQDAFNLGWKLAAVLMGTARPNLLRTYSAERQAIAKELIDFDREFARMFSAKPSETPGDGGVDPAEFQRYFVKQGRFTAGTATRYRDPYLTGDDIHQNLAHGFVPGMRFHSAPVIRLADAKPVHLGHVAEADGRWRLYIFSDQDGCAEDSALRKLCGDLSSFINSGSTQNDPDAALDIRAILQASYQTLSMNDLPDLLWPRKGRYGLRDYEKVFCALPSNDIYQLRGVDRKGCMVLVRPDQYISQLLPLSAGPELTSFLEGLL